jgi:hypothetical protein
VVGQVGTQVEIRGGGTANFREEPIGIHKVSDDFTGKNQIKIAVTKWQWIPV